jgi:DNA-binding NtrC family response regulator
MSAPARKLDDGVAVLDAPKILLIEDDESTRFLLRQTLEQQHEFCLIWATGVSEGKICFAQNEVDLIVCDQNMGDGFGTDVLRFVRERDTEIPFILFTGQFRDDLPDLKPFKCCYVQKPAITTLLAEIAYHLGGRHGRR